MAVGNVGEVIQVRARHFGRHASALSSQEKREEIEQRDLRREALRGRDGFFDAGACLQGGAGFFGNRGVGDVGDGDGFRTAIQSFALRGGGVGRLAGLRNHDDDRIGARVRGAVAILARVFHVDRFAGEIFDHDLAGEACMAARAAGGDDDFLESGQRGLDSLQRLWENYVAFYVAADRFANGLRLLVNFAQHEFRKRARVGARRGCGGGRSSFLFGLSGHQRPPAVVAAAVGIPRPSLSMMVCGSTFQPETFTCKPPKTFASGTYCAVSSRVSPGINEM